MLNRRVRIAFDWTLGVTLILVGFVGFVLPGLPGVLFLVAGLAVLSSHSRWAHALHVRVVNLARSVRERVAAGRRGADDDPGKG